MKDVSFWHLLGLAVFGLVICVLVLPTGPSKEMAYRVQCASQLNTIGKACYIYMEDFEGKMPPDLEILVETEDLVHKIFVCPWSGDEVGENSYVYRGVDLDDSSSATMVVAYDKKGNHPDGTRNVLFMDSHVKKYSAEGFRTRMERDNEIRRAVGLAEKAWE